ncbi:hypothetical protein HPHPH6_1635 [Helicobacter pylori Hp H-6]|uniref:Uncharacterized protein n=1 Tax=Helicobacter pylori Hp H-6 TaxID=992061 RepID=I9UGT0_HELPX|nr:hypothetical protein HPHPH6_1635 [Helicobacter pylori Hp H-6]
MIFSLFGENKSRKLLEGYFNGCENAHAKQNNNATKLNE